MTNSFFKLLACLLLAVCVQPAAAQVANHVGALVTAQFELPRANTGNGTIAGVEFQHSHSWRISGQELQVKTNLQVTRDLKGYLDQYGTAVRLHTRGRWYPKGGNGLFLQGGLFAGGVQYNDTATGGGYIKGGSEPVAGAGLRLPAWPMTISLDYLYIFRSPLYAQHSLKDSTGRQLDGHVRGHYIGAETSWPIGRSKWAVLANAAWQQSHYQRNKDVYGPVAGAVDHKFSEFEFSIGIGRCY